MGKVAELQNLSDKETIAVREAARGVSLNAACRLAGYFDPEAQATKLRHSPKFQSAVAAEVRRFLHTEAAPAAIRTLYNFMTDEECDKKLRIACAKTLADRAGFIAPKARDASALEQKSLVDMTADEMREMASRIQKELSDRAVVVIDHAPQDGAQPVQPTDIFD